MAVEIVWMVSDSLECPRTEFGPYFTQVGAELAAAKLHLRYLLQYEYEDGYSPRTGTGRVSTVQISPFTRMDIHTRCASCGMAARHSYRWQAEVWADIHEFENQRHVVRLFLRTEHSGLEEVPNWRHVVGGDAE